MEADITDQVKSCSSCNTHSEESGPACLDYKKTVIAQYSNSEKMLYLLDAIDSKIKVCGFFDSFYHYVWNINTASGFGLDIWGRIVGVNRKVRTLAECYWGYSEEGGFISRPYHDISGEDDNFKYDSQSQQYSSDMGTFRDLHESDLLQEYTFNDGDFRKLILAKAYANICDYSISSINFLLMTLLSPNGCSSASCKQYCQNNTATLSTKCNATCCKNNGKQRAIYILDNLNMSLDIQLNWFPTANEVALIYNAGLLFRPAGVKMNEVQVNINNQVKNKE